MAKIQIKSEKITPFGGFFPIMDSFDQVLSGVVDSTLGLRTYRLSIQRNHSFANVCVLLWRLMY